MSLKFSDVKAKLEHANYLNSLYHTVGQGEGAFQVQSYPNAVKAVINAHGRFYGLRSKYDGRGNKRTPFKA